MILTYTWMLAYLGLLLPVLAEDAVQVRVVSEGQAIVLYICKPFFDSVSGRIV